MCLGYIDALLIAHVALYHASTFLSETIRVLVIPLLTQLLSSSRDLSVTCDSLVMVEVYMETVGYTFKGNAFTLTFTRTSQEIRFILLSMFALTALVSVLLSKQEAYMLQMKLISLLFIFLP